MKKLMTVLLSALCLFSILGINVSAASADALLHGINIYGVDTDAMDTLSTFGGLKYNALINDVQTPVEDTGLSRDNTSCYYLYADKCKDVKDEKELEQYIVRDNTLKYDTNYYFVVSLALAEGYTVTEPESGKLPISINIYVNGKKEPIEARPISELINSGEEKKAKAFSLEEKKSNKILAYIPFTTEKDQKSVTLKYSVGETYEWIITNNIGTDVTNKEIWVGQNTPSPATNTEVNVEVKNLNLNVGNTLNITVDSLNIENSSNKEETNYYKMMTAEGREAKYQIKGTSTSDDEIWKDNNQTIVLKTTEPKKQVGIFSWLDGAPILAGLYEDTLTFTAEIKHKEMPKKSEKIYFDLDQDGEKDENEMEVTVLKINGSNAYVYAGREATNPDHKFNANPEDHLIEIEGQNYQNYSGSDVDSYLNGDGYYNSLPDSVKKAIIEKEYELDCWEQASSDSYDFHYVTNFGVDDYYSKLSFSTQRTVKAKVVVISLQDLVDYFGNETTAQDAKKLFITGSIWFRTNCKNAPEDYMLEVFNFGAAGAISYDSVNTTNTVSSPVCFTIDLSQVDFDIVE
ncbi:MAG: hypothetical protein Q4E33_05780 [Erysipelotrichaceae bacterium]|nr:hypothetical protein [Erysipelotrichaceae bacterium]